MPTGSQSAGTVEVEEELSDASPYALQSRNGSKKRVQSRARRGGGSSQVMGRGGALHILNLEICCKTNGCAGWSRLRHHIRHDTSHAGRERIGHAACTVSELVQQTELSCSDGGSPLLHVPSILFLGRSLCILKYFQHS